VHKTTAKQEQGREVQAKKGKTVSCQIIWGEGLISTKKKKVVREGFQRAGGKGKKGTGIEFYLKRSFIDATVPEKESGVRDRGGKADLFALRRKGKLCKNGWRKASSLRDTGKV